MGVVLTLSAKHTVEPTSQIELLYQLADLFKQAERLICGDIETADRGGSKAFDALCAAPVYLADLGPVGRKVREIADARQGEIDAAGAAR